MIKPPPSGWVCHPDGLLGLLNANYGLADEELVSLAEERELDPPGDVALPWTELDWFVLALLPLLVPV